MHFPPNQRPIFLPSGLLAGQGGGGIRGQGVRFHLPTAFHQPSPPSGQIPYPPQRQAHPVSCHGDPHGLHQHAYALGLGGYTPSFPAFSGGSSFPPSRKAPTTPPMPVHARGSHNVSKALMDPPRMPNIRSPPANPLTNTRMVLDSGCVPDSVGDESIRPAFFKTLNARRMPVTTAHHHAQSMVCERGTALLCTKGASGGKVQLSLPMLVSSEFSSNLVSL